MRIAYGVMGYGRGHATRTASVLPELMRRHEVLLLGGRDAYAALSPHFPMVRIPSLGYIYGRRGRRSLWQTAIHNAPAVLDLFWFGPSMTMVMDTLREFSPDVIISDAEAWTHRAGARLGIPRIAFDHFGILTHCRPKLSIRDRIHCEGDRFAYLALMGQPQRVIVSSFYSAPPRRPGVRVIGPLLRDEVRKMRPADGEHLLVYFNNGAHQFTDWVEAALKGLDRPVKVYGTQRIGVSGKLEFRPPANQAFVEDLASCRAVVSTAGNQLVGEAMHFGKPMLVMPEDCVEQRCNANALESMGVGAQVEHRLLTSEIIAKFLEQVDDFKESIRREARDGNAEAIEALEADLRELSGYRKASTVIRKVS